MRLRVALDRDIAIGPGKADLLEGITTTGSIAAAARRMGMSYKRAWLLVDTMNALLPDAARRRGRRAGGPAVAPGSRALGVEVLRRYRAMEAARARRGGGISPR